MITILCGKVACGKTTLAKQLQRQQSSVLLSCDDLMLTIFDDCLGDAHDRIAYKCLHYLFGLAVQHANLGISSIIDYGFWLRSERDAARRYFEKEHLDYQMILVETPDTIRFARLSKRNQALRHAKERVYCIEGDLLTRMDAKFEPLGSDEIIFYYDNTKQIHNFYF